MTVSRMRVPTIHPATAREASRSERAEKNFWYMDWLPSMSRQVGRKSSSAEEMVRSEMAVDGIDVAEDLEVSGGEGDADGGPSAEAVDEDGQREREGEGGGEGDGDVNVEN